MSRIVFALLTLWVTAAAAVGQPDPVQWTATSEPATAEPGDLVTVTLRGTITGDWRMYAMDSPAGRPLSVRFEDTAGFEALGPVQQEQPQSGFDPNFNSDYTFFEEHATVTRVFRVQEGAGGGETALTGAVTYMVCNDDVCLPPRQKPFHAAVLIDAPPGASAQAPRPPPSGSELAGEEAALAAGDDADVEAFGLSPTTSSSPVQSGSGGLGLWAFLLLAVGAGLAALLTPCVFPMIPLTVSYFLHHAGDRRKAARMASLYGLSIVVIFTSLGVAMAMLVGAAGPQLIATNPWVNFFIGAVLLIFGFSLLGYYEIRLPSAWLNYFNRQGSERGGYVGVLFMGFTLTLVSFSCTVPFVGGLLAQAVRAEWLYPILGMVVFSTVFALPFVGFALFPNALQRLPRSGSWMVSLKGVLGFVEIAAALKFFSNADLVWGLGLLPRPLAVSLMIVIFALAGLFLLGRLTLKTSEIETGSERLPESVGPFRLATAIASFGLALYLVPGLLGAPLGSVDAFLPPHRATDVSLVAASAARQGEPAGTHRGWFQTREEAFAEARRTGRPVLIDFTGYTCTNCRYMEANVLSRSPVAERIAENFVPLQLWTDDGRQGPELQRYQFELTGRIALPTYAIVDAEGRLLGQISGVHSSSRFATFLDEYLAASEALAAR